MTHEPGPVAPIPPIPPIAPPQPAPPVSVHPPSPGPPLPGPAPTGSSTQPTITGTQAGVIAYADELDPVDYVAGMWTVPYLRQAVPPGSYTSSNCASWIGLDGQYDGTTPVQLVQAGTTTLLKDGNRTAWAWAFWRPSSQELQFPEVPVEPGDVMSCSIQVTGRDAEGFIDQVTVTMQNDSLEAFVSKPLGRPTFSGYTVPAAGMTAQWLLEWVYDYPGADLGQFGSVFFDECTATRTSGAQLTPGQGQQVTMINPMSCPMAVPDLDGPVTFRIDFEGGENAGTVILPTPT
jgi:hypothetical protein